MSRVPIKALKMLAAEYGLDQVIVFAFQHKDGRTHVASWGRSIEDCDMAAAGATFAKEKFGWPESLATAAPARVQGLRKKIKALEKRIGNDAMIMGDRCTQCGHILAFSASHCPQCGKTMRKGRIREWSCGCERCLQARRVPSAGA